MLGVQLAAGIGHGPGSANFSPWLLLGVFLLIPCAGSFTPAFEEPKVQTSITAEVVLWPHPSLGDLLEMLTWRQRQLGRVFWEAEPDRSVQGPLALAAQHCAGC